MQNPNKPIIFASQKSKHPMRIKLTTTQEIEKATPFFTKDGKVFCAFYSETNIIVVHDAEENSFINMTPLKGDALKPEITAKEFEDAYVRVSERLNDLFEQGRDKVLESDNIKNSITINEP